MKESRIITSLQHPLVKHLVKLRTNSVYRYEQQALVLEGVKPIQEASSVTKLLYTPAYASWASSFVGEKWQINEAILHKVSGMISPEGLLAEIRMPSFVTLENAKQVVALEGIRDPGNLGTLLRTALALGWETIYLLPENCDLFNEKVLRAARGAHFKLALVQGTTEQLQQWVQTNHVQSLVADLEGITPANLPFISPRVLVLGNEARGPSTTIHHFCQSVTVPMSGEMESLNVAVAGGILLYLLSTLHRTSL